uniref:Uncharacterized protein n=1 Tax=Sphaeramia orbicularis TaxID=375764 RepID=A0A672ZZ29_9TELE
MTYCRSGLLSSNDPPASASRELGLQARTTSMGFNMTWLFWEGCPQGLGVCSWEFLTILPEVHL